MFPPLRPPWAKKVEGLERKDPNLGLAVKGGFLLLADLIVGSFGVDKAVVYRYELRDGQPGRSGNWGVPPIGLRLGECTKDGDPGA